MCASTTIASSWLGLMTGGSAPDEAAGKIIANTVAATRPAPDTDFNPVQRDGIGRLAELLDDDRRIRGRLRSSDG